MSFPVNHALVAYLADRQGSNGKLGKKAVQKYIHILSSLTNLDVGYKFSFYTYGPFSRDLASDLDILFNSRFIDISYNSHENSYSIKSNEKSHVLFDGIPTEIRSKADIIWGKFSGRTAKQLELTSTILFVHDEEGISINSNEMMARVKLLKPKYLKKEVEAAQSELVNFDACS